MSPDAIEVIAADGMTDTGLLDQDGNRLYREKLPVGFLAKH